MRKSTVLSFALQLGFPVSNILYTHSSKITIHVVPKSLTVKWTVNRYPCHFKNANNCLDTNIYSYLETYGGQSSDLYRIFVHYFNTSVN